MLPILLSDHALKQMERRGITRADLERLFMLGHESTDSSTPASNRPYFMDGAVAKGSREMRVVFVKRHDAVLVITAMFRD